MLTHILDFKGGGPMEVNPNEHSARSQEALVLAALKDGEALTALDALHRFGCMRMSARIYKLRQAGHEIKDAWIKVGPDNKKVKKWFL